MSLLPKDLNPNYYLPHSTGTYTCGVTIVLRVCGDEVIVIIILSIVQKKKKNHCPHKQSRKRRRQPISTNNEEIILILKIKKLKEENPFHFNSNQTHDKNPS